MSWRVLADPADLLGHALFMVEIRAKRFTHLLPFYGIVKLPDIIRADFLAPLYDLTVKELLDADGNETGYTVADISRWMPFDPKEYETES